jgi:hypothetical protein
MSAWLIGELSKSAAIRSMSSTRRSDLPRMSPIADPLTLGSAENRVGPGRRSEAQSEHFQHRTLRTLISMGLSPAYRARRLLQFVLVGLLVVGLIVLHQVAKASHSKLRELRMAKEAAKEATEREDARSRSAVSS